MNLETFTYYSDKLHQVFKPGMPIDRYELFKGRQRQVLDIYDAIRQCGRHVVLFGERGVGKTSLAKVVSEILSSKRTHVLDSGTINCDGTDDFSSLWHKAFREMTIVMSAQRGGFTQQLSLKGSLDELLPDEVTPDDVRYALSKLGEESIIILDEVDRLVDEKAKRLLADTIKNLSDHSDTVKVTIFLVGVADTVNELISEHKSIERALVQVRMPRMAKSELAQIIEDGFSSSEMIISESAKNTIVHLSQGLPFYTHYFGLYSGLKALEEDRTDVKMQDVMDSTVQIISKAYNIKSAYHTAISSPQSTSLHAEVILACALTSPDDLGYFSPSDVSHPLSVIMKKRYEVTNFNRHLKGFCEEKRGKILQSTGTERRLRYRFADPLMQPYVILEGLANNRIDLDTLIEEQKQRPRHPPRPTTNGDVTDYDVTF